MDNAAANLLGEPAAVNSEKKVCEPKQTNMGSRHRAKHDDLTGLPDRALLLDRLTEELQAASRQELSLGLIFIDLDHFNQLNDAFGRDMGDALLCELSQRLRFAVRSEDTVARYGGDEFVLLVPGLVGPNGLTRVTAALRAALDRPFAVGSRQVRLSASMGVAMSPVDGCDAAALLQRADASRCSIKGKPEVAAVGGRMGRFARLAAMLQRRAGFLACNERDMNMS